MPVQRLRVAILPLDLPCSGPITHSGEILTTGKSYGKKPDRFSSKQYRVNYYLTHNMNTISSSNSICVKRMTSALAKWGNKQIKKSLNMP